MTAARLPVITVALAMLFGIALAHAGDRWGEAFNNWRTRCHSSGFCEATTKDRDSAASNAPALLTIERTGLNAAGWVIAFDFQRAKPELDRPLSLTVDQQRKFLIKPAGFLRQIAEPPHDPDRFYVTDERLAAKLLPELLAGTDVRLDYIDVTGEAHALNFSLSGLTASVLWIESEMKIIGAPRQAIAASGATSTKQQSEIDTIRAAGIPEPVLARHQTSSECEDPDSEHMRRYDPIVELASDTAILYALPCTAGAYNVAYRLYIRERGEIGGLRTLYFASFTQSHGWTGTDILFNIDTDGPHISAFYKGRGIGDCGTIGSWTFADYEYRLEKYIAMENCNGQTPDNWPIVFPPQ